MKSSTCVTNEVIPECILFPRQCLAQNIQNKHENTVMISLMLAASHSKPSITIVTIRQTNLIGSSFFPRNSAYCDMCPIKHLQTPKVFQSALMFVCLLSLNKIPSSTYPAGIDISLGYIAVNL